MSRNFDFGSIKVVEFGICKDTDNGEQYFIVPVANNVKKVLISMIEDTVDELGLNSNLKLEPYDPSQKYGVKERLQLSLNDGMAHKICSFYEANNILTDSHALDDLDGLVFYYAIFHDSKNRKLVGIRRASQFKGVVKARLIRMIDETLKLLEDNIFKLDRDFDYLVTNQTIYILRASGFEFTADLEEYILKRAQEKTEELGKSISFIDFSSITQYVSTHKRSARLVASLSSRKDLDKISGRNLKNACKKQSVEILSENGKIKPAPGHEHAFLNLLDRRRYHVSLIDHVDEIYEASNRHSVKPALS